MLSGFDKELPDCQVNTPTGWMFTFSYVDSIPCGCVALHRLEDGICEMRRLYVKPEFRGKGFGKFLVNAVIDEAKKIGYTKMRLDTVPQMKKQ